MYELLERYGLWAVFFGTMIEGDLTLLFAGVIAVTGFWYLIERPATRLINSHASERETNATKETSLEGEEAIGAAKSSRELLAERGPILTPLPVDEYVRIAAEAYPTLTVRTI